MSKAALQQYHKIVTRVKTFPCPECKISIFPKTYQEHYKNEHNFDSKTHCVWCRGAISWPIGEKQLNANHLIRCFRKFIRKNNKIDVIFFDHTPMCEAKNLFEHQNILCEKAYEDVWPLYVSEPLGLTFQDPNINKAVSYTQFYLKHKNEIDIFHVSVKVNIFPNFLEAMDRDNGRSRTFQFSCWCDGGDNKIDKYRQHRHMIVVSPKGHFIPKVWKRIKTLDKPYHNFPSLRLKRIETPIHLVNTIGYLSQRESMCNFTFKDELLKKENLNHFHIFLELPTNFKLCVASQWPGGILQLATQKLHHTDGKKLFWSTKMIDGRWRTRVEDVPDLFKNAVLPVAKNFKPTTTPTEYFIYLTEERKMYFEKCDHDLDNWLELQVEGGNLFYRAIANEYLALRQKHQLFLTDIETCIGQFYDKLRDSYMENDKLKEENDKLKEENDKLKYQMEII